MSSTTASLPSAERVARRHPPESGLAAYWDGRAARWDAEDPWAVARTRDARDDWKAVLRDVIGDEPKIVLDAGTGTGDLALVLDELGHVVRGVDVSPAMLRRAQAKTQWAHVDLRCAPAERLPFADGAVDVVVARHLLWDVPSPEETAREWVRVLRPRGRIVVLESRWVRRAQGPVAAALHRLVPGSHVLARDLPPGAPAERRRVPDRDEAVEFLRDAGLEAVLSLDLSCVRRRSWAALPRLVRAFAAPRSVHYAAWGMKPW